MHIIFPPLLGHPTGVSLPTPAASHSLFGTVPDDRVGFILPHFEFCDDNSEVTIAELKCSPAFGGWGRRLGDTSPQLHCSLPSEILIPLFVTVSLSKRLSILRPVSSKDSDLSVKEHTISLKWPYVSNGSADNAIPFLCEPVVDKSILVPSKLRAAHRTQAGYTSYLSLLRCIFPPRYISFGWLPIGHMSMFIPYPLQIMSNQGNERRRQFLPSHFSRRVPPWQAFPSCSHPLLYDHRPNACCTSFARPGRTPCSVSTIDVHIPGPYDPLRTCGRRRNHLVDDTSLPDRHSLGLFPAHGHGRDPGPFLSPCRGGHDYVRGLVLVHGPPCPYYLCLLCPSEAPCVYGWWRTHRPPKLPSREDVPFAVLRI